MKLSTYFTLDEMTESQTATRRGINNTPQAGALANLESLCSYLLDPIRKLVGGPVIVTSGYRSIRLNTAIGGARNSQHIAGEAADIKTPAMSAQSLFDAIRASTLVWDQLIYEGTWVHVSYTTKRVNRREVLICTFKDGKAIYRRVG